MAYPTKKDFLELTGKYLEGAASKDEIEIVEAYYELFSDEPEVMERIEAFGLTGVEQRIKQRINKRIKELEAVPVRSGVFNLNRIWYRISVAAVLLVSLSLGLYFYINRSASYSAMLINVQNDIAPGTNQAVLTLANGKKILLKEQVYTVSSDTSVKASGIFNEITTPRGGQYQVRLADGTAVWLNAESSLKFPASFSGLKDRIVELKGEAYFEVAKVTTKGERSQNKAYIPFIVKSETQRVEVLGTHFNVQSYNNDENVKTTLLEGIVRVSASPMQTVTLKPNQQSVLTKNGLHVSDTDVEEAVAWKTGLFMFNGENLENIMLKISRWYNVEVRYHDENLRTKVFSGSFSRFTNISKVLQKIELTGAARFDVKDGVITVYQY